MSLLEAKRYGKLVDQVLAGGGPVVASTGFLVALLVELGQLYLPIEHTEGFKKWVNRLFGGVHGIHHLLRLRR